MASIFFFPIKAFARKIYSSLFATDAMIMNNNKLITYFSKPQLFSAYIDSCNVPIYLQQMTKNNNFYIIKHSIFALLLLENESNKLFKVLSSLGKGVILFKRSLKKPFIWKGI
jgi:hypothetical protein